MSAPIRVNHSVIYATGLGLIIISLPLSQFALSVGQFILVGNWLLEGNIKNKYKAFLLNKAAIVLVSLFILHVAGLLFTTDFNYAFKDLRIKLPLLVLPIILSTTNPLESKKFDGLIWLFIGACLAATLIGFSILLFKDISDIREISPFISHIRLSLNICLAIFFSGYFLFSKYQHRIKFQLLLAFLILWFMAYLIFSESATGFYIMFVSSFVLVIWGFTRIQNRMLRRLVIILTLIIPIGLGLYLYLTAKIYLTPNNKELKNLEYYSSKGNLYSHDTTAYTVENGNYIGLYVCEAELRENWNERSKLDYDGKDNKGQELKTTLIRYLNSKGFRKDTEGMGKLGVKDIRNIENGIANYCYTRKFDLNSRVYQILWEYQMMKRDANPGGSSLLQRLVFWKAAGGIIVENIWWGVGTGDMDKAFSTQYEKMKTRLAPEFRFRSHNQFLAIFAAFGFFGFLWFIFTLFYPPIKLKAFQNFRYVVFFTVILLSMLAEDTLETQMGVTLFAFFNTFLLFANKDDHKSINL
jgi:hypothetical protein